MTSSLLLQKREYLLTYNLRDSDCSLAIPHPALVIVKEVWHTAEVYCGIVYPWIFVSHLLMMNLNLS